MLLVLRFRRSQTRYRSLMPLQCRNQLTSVDVPQHSNSVHTPRNDKRRVEGLDAVERSLVECMEGEGLLREHQCISEREFGAHIVETEEVVLKHVHRDEVVLGWWEANPFLHALDEFPERDLELIAEL